MGKKLAILALMLLAFSILWAPFGPAGAFFYDKEGSAQATITAWAWEQSDDLEVSTRYAGIWSWASDWESPYPDTPGESWEGSILYGVFLRDTGEYDITIDKLKVFWNPHDGSEHTRAVQIIFNNGIEWAGSASSGTTLDIHDCTLNPSDLLPKELFILFDANMQGKTFMIQFIMSDGSSKSVQFTPGGHGL